MAGDCETRRLMSHRFYCPQLAEAGSVTLTDSEAHHLAHVLRSQPDDIVELFNGNGLVATCRVVLIRKRDVELEVQSARSEEPPQKILTIATAVPKGDRFDWLIEKATELGVSRLIPLTTSRSVVDPRTSKLDKLRQTVVAACKQSGRNHLMEIGAVTSWPEFIKQFVPDHTVLIAHPQGDSLESIGSLVANHEKPLLVAIGPEGGFSEVEIQLALRAGAKSVALGRQILRIETAAIGLAAKFLL